MSFITYSTDADILLPLTSDREEIHRDLLRLQKLVPEGRAFMHKGFMKANEQIRDATLGDNNVNSLIIAVTAGPLMMHTFKETLEEANKSWRMGATVYTVGVHEYNKKQMIDIADSPSNSFGVDKGFPAMQDIIDSLSKWDVEDWGDPVCIPRGLLDPIKPPLAQMETPYLVLDQSYCILEKKPGHMQQLLSTMLPPDAIDVVSSYGPGLDTIDSMLIMISFDSEEHQQGQLNPDVF
ncbi:hypothetical protein STEG23_029104 [Scotinomys teguina]